jgi:hypothetical protein
MRLFYASLVVGIASFAGAVASVFAREWLLAGILVGVFAGWCLVAARLVKRIPEEKMRQQSRIAEDLMRSIGRAESGGWTPKRRSDAS